MHTNRGSGGLQSGGPALPGSHTSFQGLKSLCVCSFGEKITLTLCFSHPSLVYVYVCLSVRALPHPHFSFFFFFLIYGYFLLVCGLDSVGPPMWSPPPAAELVQLGLLGSLRNLPVSKRVQLAHLGQLRLHHGCLGLHREGDRPGSQPPRSHFSPSSSPPLPAACCLRHRNLETQNLHQELGDEGGEVKGIFLEWVSGSQARSVRSSLGRPEGEAGLWGTWRCEGFFPEQCRVLICLFYPAPHLPTPPCHHTVGCDISLHQAVCFFRL